MAEEIRLSESEEERLVKELERQIEVGEDFRSTSDW